MSEIDLNSTLYVLYAPGFGFLFGNKLETSKKFTKARLFSKKHFAVNSLKMQDKSHRGKISKITVDGNIKDIKVLTVSVSIKPEDVFMSELGGDA